MNGVHDLGGMDGFGPVIPEQNEPVFHHDWERRVFGLALSPSIFGTFFTRHSIERMPPADYLASSYYEHWLSGIERGLIENGVLTRLEIEEALHNPREPHRPQSAPTNVAPAAVATAERPRKARFAVGAAVVARNLNPPGHTRLPRYVRGHRGIIRRDWGVFTFPDTNARGLGRKPQHCYSAEFTARELWGADRPANERILIDLWDDYLQADPNLRAKRPIKVQRPVRGQKPKSAKTRNAVGARMRPAAKKLAKETRKRR
jgi:nitrile hydratase